jgi:hypothetical protein
MNETKENPKDESELELLLKKNAYGEGLTPVEMNRARYLIWADPVYAKEDCGVCKTSTPNEVDKAIYDTGLCRGHASYALATRK